MGQVVVTLNGRTYRLECNEGEEAHLLGLAEYIGAHVDDMRRKFGQVGDDRLILMASLLVTDELWAMRTELDNLRAHLRMPAAINQIRRNRPVDRGAALRQVRRSGGAARRAQRAFRGRRELEFANGAVASLLPLVPCRYSPYYYDRRAARCVRSIYSRAL